MATDQSGVSISTWGIINVYIFLHCSCLQVYSTSYWQLHGGSTVPKRTLWTRVHRVQYGEIQIRFKFCFVNYGVYIIYSHTYTKAECQLYLANLNRVIGFTKHIFCSKIFLLKNRGWTLWTLSASQNRTLWTLGPDSMNAESILPWITARIIY